MHYFQYRGKKLYCEDVPVAAAARRVGTPFYLYSQATLERHFRVFDRSFHAIPHLTCYAVKANSNIAVLHLFRRMGSGFDIVSGGELLRVLKAGARPQKVVFSGVGKTPQEIDLGLQKGILQFNIESAAELLMIEERARAMGKTAPIALRVNPDVDSNSHTYMSTGLRQHKFGVPFREAPALYRRAIRSSHLKATGIGFHIGSQIVRVEPFLDALNRLKELIRSLRARGHTLEYLDIGGGLGIVYNDELPPHPEEYGRAIMDAVKDLDCTLLLEPGRVIAGSAGILVARVLLTKKNEGKNFVVVDAGMNDLIRPSLYGSFHAIQPETLSRRQAWTADIVGPICESGDFLARDRRMPRVRAQELLAIMSAGAYGFVQASNYNSRPRIPEVLVLGKRMKVIRKRETFSDLVRNESVTPL